MFTHPLDDYDFVIHLDPEVLPRYHQNISFNPTSRYANAASSRPSLLGDKPLIGFDPATLFFEDLQVRNLLAIFSSGAELCVEANIR